MKAIEILSNLDGSTIYVNPLHLVTWQEFGEYTAYELTNDGQENSVCRRTLSSAADIAEQFANSFAEFAAAIQGGAP